MKDESHLPVAEQSLVFRLRKRAEIRRQIPGRKSVEEGARDRIADLLEEAADRIEQLEDPIQLRHPEQRLDLGVRADDPHIAIPSVVLRRLCRANVRGAVCHPRRALPDTLRAPARRGHVGGRRRRRRPHGCGHVENGRHVLNMSRRRQQGVDQ